MTHEEKLKKETELVSEFMTIFYDELGYYPTVVTRNNRIHNKDDLKVISLSTLKTFFEPFLPTMYGKTLNLSARNRSRYLVELRFIYFFVARSMGYNVASIGRSLNMDHTSVLHGLRTFRNLYETNDLFREKYIKIINCIKENYDASIMEHLDKVELES